MAATIAAACIGDVGIFVTPFLLGAIVENYQISESAVSFIVSGRIALLALTTLMVSVFLPRLHLRRTALVAVSFAFFGNLISGFAGSVPALIVGRLITGVGEGACCGIGLALAARRRDPDRAFAIITFAAVVIVVGVLFVLPNVVEAVGQAGTFVAMAAFLAVMAPPLIWIPATRLSKDPREGSIGLSGGAGALLLAALLISLASNTLWFYVERMGHALDLTLTQISRFSALSAALSVIGPATVYFLGSRFGRLLPISAALVAQCVGGLVLTHTTSQSHFIVTMIALNILIVFVVPYYRAAAAQLDPTGRIAVATGGAAWLGIPIGPAIGGVIFALDGGYPEIGWLAAMCFALALVTLFQVIRRTDAEVG
jgi:predicted MFS family arabinose efflux permease